MSKLSKYLHMTPGELCRKAYNHGVGWMRRTITNPLQYELCKLIPDKVYLKHRYRRLMGKNLNLDPPVTYNEKLNWMKLNDRDPLYTRLADKLTAREYVRERIGEEYLVPLLGVWDRPEDIDFDMLPNQFVLKCTHDSGSYIVCKDKNAFDKKRAVAGLKQCQKTNFFYFSREWAYKNIRPRIIAEKYLEDINDRETRDYKFFLFDGIPRFFYIATDRGIGQTKFDYFDMEFHHLDVRQHYPNSEKSLAKPQNFAQMIEMSQKLAAGLRHVRVDFYDVNGRVYFSEFTFYNNGGVTPYDPETWDYSFGKWLRI